MTLSQSHLAACHGANDAHKPSVLLEAETVNNRYRAGVPAATTLSLWMPEMMQTNPEVDMIAEEVSANTNAVQHGDHK